jgi:hypothetical protein
VWWWGGGVCIMEWRALHVPWLGAFRQCCEAVCCSWSVSDAHAVTFGDVGWACAVQTGCLLTAAVILTRMFSGAPAGAGCCWVCVVVCSCSLLCAFVTSRQAQVSSPATLVRALLRALQEGCSCNWFPFASLLLTKRQLTPTHTCVTVNSGTQRATHVGYTPITQL